MTTHATTLPPSETPEKIRGALGRGEICLIDVREPGEYAARRIAGALLFPLSTLDVHAVPVGGRPVVFYCGTGKRSAKAFEMCARAGVTIRSHLAGGLEAWLAAGLPVIETDPGTGAIRFVVV
jgi:rhodanese-related sulfurtransferase